jgi:two-component system chemotaxis sensor kinase CheA
LELKAIVQSTITMPIVIIKKDAVAIALLVEEIIGEREMVIKPLPVPMVDLALVAGGTLAGNGQVIVVLNAAQLIDTALHTKKTSNFNTQTITKSNISLPHILVVDDSITTRTLEKNILESKGYKVTIAVNGKDAWNLVQKENFALVITDVSMPIMDGFTLTEQIKSNAGLKHIPVIIVTSLDSNSEKQRGIEVGADAYIVKSEFESGNLLEIVTQLV